MTVNIRYHVPPCLELDFIIVITTNMCIVSMLCILCWFFLSLSSEMVLCVKFLFYILQENVQIPEKLSTKKLTTYVFILPKGISLLTILISTSSVSKFYKKKKKICLAFNFSVVGWLYSFLYFELMKLHMCVSSRLWLAGRQKQLNATKVGVTPHFSLKQLTWER